MTKEAEMLAQRFEMAKLWIDDNDPPYCCVDLLDTERNLVVKALRAAARPAPAAGVIDREAVALEIWHRFANSNVQTFEDETHKAEYLMCADAILALLSQPTMAGEPVANAVDAVLHMTTLQLADRPAPSGRDPATIEAAARVVDAEAARILSKQDSNAKPVSINSSINSNLRMMACMLPAVSSAIRALAAPAVVGNERA